MTIKDTALWAFILAGIAANLIFQDSLAKNAAEAREREQLHGLSQVMGEQRHAGRISIR